MYALAHEYRQEDHQTFLGDLIEGGYLTLTCESSYILTSSRGVRVDLVALLADDFAWSVLTAAEVWSMSSRLQWLFVVGLDPAELPPEFYCQMYEITRERSFSWISRPLVCSKNMARKHYTRTEMISHIAVTIRDHRDGDTTLRDFFVGLTDRSMWVLIEYSETFGDILSKGDRNFIISTLSQAIIVVGERADRVQSATRKNKLLQQMAWLNECQTNLVKHGIRQETTKKGNVR